jgi:phage-related protein
MLDLGTLQLGIKVNGDAAKGELNALGGEVEKTGSKTDTLAGKAKTMIKAFVAAYAIKELVALGKAALDAYAQFEQLEGGVNKIFGKEAAQQVMKNANEAYKTAGMSANQYMETVTNFSASLISSMGGNSKEAAKVADMAIRDMSDNANTFGTNMKSIQDAYQGFAKQNYTMLDNLKLGYGGTKTEMERLLADAEKLTGQKFDINNLDDVYKAIHAVQQEYNITGTTAKEASKTIEGSMNMTKASWENMLTAIGRGKGVDKATTQLLDSLGTLGKNVAPVALNIIKSLVEGLVKAVPKMIGKLGDVANKLADGIEKGGKGNLGQVAVKLLTQLVTGLIKNLPKLAIGALRLVVALGNYLLQAAPQLVVAGVKAMGEFVKGFLQGHPQIAKAVQKIGKVFSTVFGPVITIIKKVIQWWKALLGQKKDKKFSVSTPFSGAIQSIKDVFGKWKDVLGQTAKKTYSVFKSGFSGVIDGMKSIYSHWKKILDQKSSKTFTVTHQSKGSTGGGKGHRIGLREVPYDGYEAILHKGEAVMTAAEVNKLKKQGEVHREGDSISVNVYGSANMNVNELAAAVERRIINIQKRRTNAWA